MTKNPEIPSFCLFNESCTDIPLDNEFASEITNLVFRAESVKWSGLELVYVDEHAISELNKNHLQKTYITDIITFHYNEEKEPVEATLFCCAQRIKEQAKEFDCDIKSEFCRVLIHGILHLCGYEDTTDKQKLQMRNKENHYLKQLL